MDHHRVANRWWVCFCWVWRWFRIGFVVEVLFFFLSFSICLAKGEKEILFWGVCCFCGGYGTEAHFSICFGCWGWSWGRPWIELWTSCWEMGWREWLFWWDYRAKDWTGADQAAAWWQKQQCNFWWVSLLSKVMIWFFLLWSFILNIFPFLVSEQAGWKVFLAHRFWFKPDCLCSKFLEIVIICGPFQIITLFVSIHQSVESLLHTNSKKLEVKVKLRLKGCGRKQRVIWWCLLRIGFLYTWLMEEVMMSLDMIMSMPCLSVKHFDWRFSWSKLKFPFLSVSSFCCLNSFNFNSSCVYTIISTTIVILFVASLVIDKKNYKTKSIQYNKVVS